MWRCMNVQYKQARTHAHAMQKKIKNAPVPSLDGDFRKQERLVNSVSFRSLSVFQEVEILTVGII